MLSENVDPKFAKWFTHSLANPMALNEIERLKHFNKDKQLSAATMLKQMSERGICPRCESMTYRTEGWQQFNISQCPKCGYHGKTVTIDEYLNKRLYR